jgi:predicted nucleic acid-binding protein
MAGAADYLVTGDADLLTLGKYMGLSIVEAREFLSVVD